MHTRDASKGNLYRRGECKTIPYNIIAALFGFKPEELFKVDSEEARTKEREQNQKQFEASQRLTREENEKNRKLQEEESKKNRIWNFASQVGGSMLSGLWG